jgi:hypothetical protein
MRLLLGGFISCILIVCDGFASSSNKLLFIKRKYHLRGAQGRMRKKSVEIFLEST